MSERFIGRRSFRGVATRFGVLGAAVLTVSMPATAFAIPPPQVLGLVGGVVLAPVLLVLPLVLLLLRRLLVATGLHLVRPRWYHVLLLLLLGAAWLKSGADPRVGGRLIEPPPEELAQVLSEQRPPIVVDMRGDHTFSAWHLRGAIHAYGYDEARRVAEEEARQRPEASIVFYCYLGSQGSTMAREVAEAGFEPDSPFAGRRVVSVDDGASSLMTGRLAGVVRTVRTVPDRIARAWTAAGHFERIEIDDGDLGDELALEALRRRLARRRKPVFVAAPSAHIDAIDREIAAVAATPIVYVRSDEVEERGNLLSTPVGPFPRLSALAARGSGGGWGTVAIVWAAALVLSVGLRRRSLRRAMRGRGDGRRIGAVLFHAFASTGTTLLVAQLTVSDPRFYGLDYTSDLPLGIPGGWMFNIAIVALGGGILLSYGNPVEARTERILRAISRPYGVPPPVVEWTWSWVSVAVVVAPLTVVAALAVGKLNVPTLLTALGGVVAPSGIDAAFAAWWRWRLGRAADRIALLARWAGIRPRRRPVRWRVETFVPSRPGCFRLTGGDVTLEVGAASGRALEPPDGVELPPIHDVQRVCRTAGAFRSRMGNDLSIDVDDRGTVVALRALGSARPDNDPHEVLLCDVVVPDGATAGALDAPRLSRRGFEEVARSPTPLTLDVLRSRWRRGGGALRALTAFGVRPRPPRVGAEILHALGDAIYKDLRVEGEVLGAGPIALRLRAFVLRRTAELAVDNGDAVFESTIAPPARRRIQRWRRLDLQGRSARSATGAAVTALRQLGGDSARWQEEMSLAHQQCFEALRQASERHGHSLPALLAAPPGEASALRSYELFPGGAASRAPDAPSPNGGPPAALLACRERFARAERLRQEARELYLQELDAVADLVAGLGERLDLAGVLPYLTVEELARAHRRRWRPSLVALAAARRERWEAAGRTVLPEIMTVMDLEEARATDSGALAVGSAAAPTASATDRALAVAAVSDPVASPNPAGRRPQLAGVRVSGPPHAVTGIARVIDELDGPLQLAAGEVLVTRQVDARWVPRLRGGAGLISEAGGFLSHAAILARELSLPAVMGAAGATSALRSGQRVRLLPDGGVEWGSEEEPVLWMPLALAGANGRVGRKARRLAEVASARLSVPPAAVLLDDALRLACSTWAVAPPRFGDATSPPAALSEAELPAPVRDALGAIIDALGIPAAGLIVRSSAAAEDAAHHSFAGLFHSQAGVHAAAELAAAVRRCWAAAWSAAGGGYGDDLRGRELVLDLVVQHYVTADVGGVLFTVDPVTGGRDVFVLEAARGGPGTVVAGGTPDARARLPRDGGAPVVEGDVALLTGFQLERLRAVGVQLEEHFGAAQDIEWLFAGNELFVVQARDASGPPRLQARAPCP